MEQVPIEPNNITLSLAAVSDNFDFKKAYVESHSAYGLTGMI